MTVASRVLPDRYVDSVVLMRLSQRLTQLPGVVDAAAMMATEANKAMLADGGFATKGSEDARADDLIVAVKAADADTASAALADLEELLKAPAETTEHAVRTLDEALARQPASNIAVISLPGEYAAGEARRALEKGLNVFLFSSNVSLDDEVALKRLARERNLLCMGPDCGSAIIGGVGLGFANAVRRGPVGIVAAAGSGLQAVTCLLDRFHVGISHAIGTGGRDLSDAVGGSTMLAGLDALLADAGTKAILLLAKPGGEATSARVREAAVAAHKPVVCCFLGEPGGFRTLDDAAWAVAKAVRTEMPASSTHMPTFPALPAGRRWIRGLYSGGTLAYEAQMVVTDAGLDVASNTPLASARMLDDPNASGGHTIVDLGSEGFTRGRPHPMIDPRTRLARLAADAADPETAVIVLDVILGYGAAADPAGDLADAIRSACEKTTVVASVCGTLRDPQGLVGQAAKLRTAGALVLPTNAEAVRVAVEIVGGQV
jgi:FdrA protein